METMHMLIYLKYFEKITTTVLILLMGIIIVLGIAELVRIIVMEITTPPILQLNIDEILDIFGFFFVILIAIELMDTMKAYFLQNAIHAEVVLLVAIVAIARKVILLDTAELDGMKLVGIAVILCALSGSYYLLKKQTGNNTKK